MRGWFRPKVRPPNPFGELQEDEPQGDSEEGGTKTESKEQSKRETGDTHASVSPSENENVATSFTPDDHTKDKAEEDGGVGDPAEGAHSLGVPDTAGASSEAAGDTCPHSMPDLAETGVPGCSSAASGLSVTNVREEHGPGAPESSGPTECEIGVSAVAGGSAAGALTTLEAAQSRPLPKSRAVPVIPAACPQSTAVTGEQTEKSKREQTSQSKVQLQIQYECSPQNVITN